MDSIDFLKDADNDRCFWLRNGVIVRNIYELAREINNCNEATFSYHCNPKNDDFANWIGGSIEDIELSQKLRGIYDKQQYLKIINRRIKLLESRNKRLHTHRILAEKVRTMFKDYSHVLLLIVVMVAASIITAIIYFEYHSFKNLQYLDEKISYIENRNDCFNNYFSEQTIKTRALITNYSMDLESECIYDYANTYNAPEDLLENKPAIVSREKVFVDEKNVYIMINDSYIAFFSNSSSMIPTINHNTIGIEVKPEHEIDLNIGDVISFRSGTEVIIHRIVDKGYDKEGFYAITKGDNNDAVDPNKVRFDDIQGRIVAVIY